ncbi:MAG: hypothetical protein KKA42_03660 [candidate division Zixibacteria bacterium]|nr:hypothetical protein [candidate division Zixibacteria bacterium]
MSIRTVAACCYLCLLSVLPAHGAGKTQVRIEKLGEYTPTDLHVGASLAAADTCLANDNHDIVYRIDGWVTGYELYKGLIDPANSCDNAYPYTVLEVNMPMRFEAATSLVVSVDIEAADLTSVPGCPIPGELLGLSAEWNLTIPGSGTYNVWIPLDTPIVVNEPFFAGYYLGSPIDQSVGCAVLCDSIPVLCASFNIWDTAVGWVDLADNEYFAFPGRLAMEVSGIPGGTAAIPPVASLVCPDSGADVFGTNIELWAYDTAGSPAVDYASFEYSDGGAYVEIGRDYDGTAPLRNGVAPTEPGQGYSVFWHTSGLPEGAYTIRTTFVDTTGATSSVITPVRLEPTPPVPGLAGLPSGSYVCAPWEFSITCPDEDISYIEVARFPAIDTYSTGLTVFSQSLLGDTNGNPGDGNLIANGEYGEYCSGPAAAAMASRVWYDRGYVSVLRDSTTSITVTDLAEMLAEAMKTRRDSGTYDDALLNGWRAHFAHHTPEFEFDHRRNPTYYDVRTWVEESQRTVVLGLGGNPGLWVAVDGFSGWQATDTAFEVTVANPVAGSLVSGVMIDRGGVSELTLDETVYTVDIMVSMTTLAWTISRPVACVDFSGTDGWGCTWSSAGIDDGTPVFLRTSARDAANNQGYSTVMVSYDCAFAHVQGDYTGDGLTDIDDLLTLIPYVTGGAGMAGVDPRFDANCDNVINIADAVYYMNFLFGATSAPCH